MKPIDALRPALPALMLALLMSGCATKAPMQQGPVPPVPSAPREEAPGLTPKR